MKYNTVGRTVLKIYKPCQVLAAKLNIRYNIVSRIVFVDNPYKLIWVDPNSITETSLNYENERVLRTLGSVRRGNWDKRRTLFQDMPIYKALSNHFKSGVPLNQIPFFYNPEITTQKAQDERGRSWEFISAFEYDRRSDHIDQLYHSIKTRGYLTQNELGGETGDEIKVKISREGHLLFLDGIHRLSICKMLGMKQVPVVVHTRHSEWHAFKKELTAYARRQQLGTPHAGEIYQKLNHPDLQDIPYSHQCIDRFNAIKNHIKNRSGKVLDIGAYLGYFCHRLEDEGYYCTAIESDQMLAYFMHRLKTAENKNFHIVKGDILKSFSGEVRFDVVLALNIFHHFLKTKETFHALTNFLANLHVKEIFFEPHNVNELADRGCFINPTNEEFLELIMKHTGLTNFAGVLDCAEGRKLYHLWK